MVRWSIGLVQQRGRHSSRRAVCRRPAEQRITQQLSYDKISRADYRRPRGQTARRSVRGVVVKLLAVTTPERRRHNASLRLPPRSPAVDSHARHAFMVPGGTVGHFVIATRPATPHKSSVDERSSAVTETMQNYVRRRTEPQNRTLFMAALCNRGAIIFLPCSFFYGRPM